MSIKKKVNLVFTSPTKFDSIYRNIDNTIAFLTNGEIRMGEKSFGSSIKIFDNHSIPIIGIENKLYVNKDTGELKYFEAGEFHSLSRGISGEISIFEDETDITKNDLVTKAAVINYIKALVNAGSLAGGLEGPQANIPSSSVKTNKDITVIDQKLGKYRPGDIIKSGTNINTILENIFTNVIDVVYDRPIVKISPNGLKVEAGTSQKFNFKINYDKGDAGDIDSVLLLKGANNVYGDPIFFSKYLVKEYTTPEPIIITDSDVIQYKVLVKYKEGEIKSNNIGEQQPDGVIQAGSVEDVCNLIGARRTWYMSTAQTDLEFEASSSVRGIHNSVLDMKKGSSFNIEVNKGDRTVVIAYPKYLGELESITSRALNMDISDNFTITTTLVEGANNYRSIEYYIYQYTPAIPFEANETLRVDI